MLNVYCISGMGVDGRLFKNLKLDNCILHHIKWKAPLKNETLPAYAMRLGEEIDASKPFALVGVSFGGMNCIEIAKQMKPVKTFVISSCKKSNELPFRIRFWRFFLPLLKLSDKFYIQGSYLMRGQFGVTGKEQTERFMEMLRAAPHHYFGGAIACILKWKNEIVPDNVIQIHGTKDKILPVRRIKCDYRIEGGSHYMIVNRGREISEIINKELEKMI
jgi:hypothetical protein